MKKLTFILIAILAVCTWSCQDDSGEYIEHLYTDSELSKAATSCLTVAKDTAVAHICITNGMEAYRITFPNSGSYRAIRDTLANLNRSDLLDTLYNRINRACELMGDDATNALKSHIDALTFNEPYNLIYGPKDTISSYFNLYCGSKVRSSLTSALNVQFANTGATSTWNEIINLYNNNSTSPISIDLCDFVLVNFTDAIVTEMGKEEALIRSDSTHRVTPILKRVFGNN